MAAKTVTLISPDGGQVNVSHPADVNSLVFGSGYKPKVGTVDDALATLAKNDVVVDAAADQALVTQTTTTQVKPSK